MKYIITSIQKGARVHQNFLSNMLLFREKHKVDKILVFIMRGSEKNNELHPTVLDFLRSRYVEVIEKDYNIHTKVKCYNTRVLPQNINPMLGQATKLPSEYSYVLPATKVRYKSHPSLGVKPRFFNATGAMTYPNYNTIAKSSGQHVKRGLQAKQMHTYGFSYFQNDGKKFDVYPLSADKSGNFYYLNERYYNGKFTTGKYIEALVLGDWHFGDTNPEIRKRTIQLIEGLKPKRVVFHDLFDGYSINHHKQGKLLEALRSNVSGREILKDELLLLLKEIRYFANKFPNVKFIVPESNHDVFIRTYLDNKFHHYEPRNYLQAIKIIPRILDLKKVALKEALLTVGKSLPKNFIFLRENDAYRIGGKVKGVAIGQHGHKGVNGARGSVTSFKRNNTKMITAHTHSPEIYENGMIVGTSTFLELDYTIGGLSSWLNAHGVLYKNMTYSLLTIIPEKTKRT